MKGVGSFSRRDLPKTVSAIICVLASFVSFSILAQEPAPQQSTTGPVPPQSIVPRSSMELVQSATAHTIASVPDYLWRHGCGPTAVGMVLGYYDGHGFPDLFDGDATTQTSAVNQGIASEGSGNNTTGTQLHYEDYALPLDSSPGPFLPDRSETYLTNSHTDDSVADFMHTSWSADSNYYGWSWSNKIGPSFAAYVSLRNAAYVPTYGQYSMGSTLTWDVLTNEIDNNRPMVFLVDSDGNGGTDHFVTIVGYDDGPPQQYACLDTWAPTGTVRWEQFRAMSSSYGWGVWGGWSFELSLPVVLTVNSSGASGVSISSNTGHGGTTDYTKNNLASGTFVNLTAPATIGNAEFMNWSGSVSSTSQTIDFSMTSDKTVSANYRIVINFPDENLEQAIRDAISKPTGDIYQSDLLGLSLLDPSRF